MGNLYYSDQGIDQLGPFSVLGNGIKRDELGAIGGGDGTLQVYYSGCEPSNLEVVANCGGEETCKTVFTPTESIFDVSIVSLTWRNSETGQMVSEYALGRPEWDSLGKKYIPTIDQYLFRTEFLSRGQAVTTDLVVASPFGSDLPEWAVMYTDQTGAIHAYICTASGGNHEYSLMIDIDDIMIGQ